MYKLSENEEECVAYCDICKNKATGTGGFFEHTDRWLKDGRQVGAFVLVCEKCKDNKVGIEAETERQLAEGKSDLDHAADLMEMAEKMK